MENYRATSVLCTPMKAVNARQWLGEQVYGLRPMEQGLFGKLNLHVEFVCECTCGICVWACARTSVCKCSKSNCWVVGIFLNHWPHSFLNVFYCSYFACVSLWSVCVSAGRMPRHVYGSERTSFGSWFHSSTVGFRDWTSVVIYTQSAPSPAESPFWPLPPEFW